MLKKNVNLSLIIIGLSYYGKQLKQNEISRFQITWECNCQFEVFSCLLFVK